MTKKEAILKTLTDYEMSLKTQQEKIFDIRFQINFDQDPENAILQFLRTNEELYLKQKKISYDILGWNLNNPIEEYGTTDSFSSDLSEISPDVWRFTLPPFYSIQNKKRFSNEGKHIYYLVTNLEEQYEREHGSIDKMERPLVYFRHHICTETDRIFDYDNVDSRRAIDAMQGYFLKGDDAIYLTTVHDAVKDAERSYCEITVLDRAKNQFDFGGIIAAEIPAPEQPEI